ncbi:MAG TPA: DNA polymerase III subunit gamma/tau [Desulfurivibrionaceae bacterium]|nr:DNA polymerase III subunit gamma/tau [Desulfurivibrionaceae bacterium]
MSYLVLARKWRPQTFDQVVGQQPVVRTLQNALRLNRVAHAMLFSGVRGTGKTTLARLMAKAINCQEGAPEQPCNQCESCREITEGRAIDLHEIDGASNRGIQEIRELKENIRFLPSKSKYKIIIIDEVHMLTVEAFNALLKTLEEPPAHVYFMFATTELHKIPITILSRCQRYELKRVPFVELFVFFQKVAGAEGVEIADQALEMIAREAEGSVRDGLSLLDQIFSYGGSQIGVAEVTQVLGLVDRTVFEKLARAVLSGDLAGSLALFDQSYNAGIDLKRFASDLLHYFRALAIVKAVKEPGPLLDLSDRELATLQEIAGAHSAETLFQYFNLLVKGIEELQYSSRPRLTMEMALVKAVQAGQVVPAGELLRRLDGLLQGVPLPAKAYAPQPTASAAVLREPESAALAAAPPPTQKKSDDSGPVASPAPAPDATVASPPQPFRDIRRHWDEFLRYVKERKLWMGQVLGMAVGVQEEGARLQIKFDDAADCKMLEEHDNLRLLTELAQDFFQKTLVVAIQSRGGAKAEEAGDEVTPQEERRALANDPLVQMAAEVFGGQVTGVRTGPRSR